MFSFLFKIGGGATKAKRVHTTEPSSDDDFEPGSDGSSNENDASENSNDSDIVVVPHQASDNHRLQLRPNQGETLDDFQRRKTENNPSSSSSSQYNQPSTPGASTQHTVHTAGPTTSSAQNPIMPVKLQSMYFIN